jgi:hypothetical protein
VHGSRSTRVRLFSNSLIKRQCEGIRTTEFGDYRNERVLDPASFKQGSGAAEVGFRGHCAKKLLEITTSPSNVPARESKRCIEKRRDAFD